MRHPKGSGSATTSFLSSGGPGAPEFEKINAGRRQRRHRRTSVALTVHPLLCRGYHFTVAEILPSVI